MSSKSSARRLAADYRIEWMNRLASDRTIGTKAMQVALAFALEIDWGGPEAQWPGIQRLAARTGLSEDDVLSAGRQLRDRAYVRCDLPNRKIKSPTVIPFPGAKQ
jgi:hypothetical protein